MKACENCGKPATTTKMIWLYLLGVLFANDPMEIDVCADCAQKDLIGTPRLGGVEIQLKHKK